MWEQSRVGSSPTSGTMAYYRTPTLSNDKELQAYIIGLAIGDGNLSCINKTTRLRISCDTKYPNLIKCIIESLQLLLPCNKISTTKKPGNCLDICIYSNHIENLLGWKAKAGSKFIQNVYVPEWIKQNDDYKIKCLKGLIETDGSIYLDRGYKMVMFVTIIPDLAKSVLEMINSLGFKSRLYKLNPSPKSKFKSKVLYHVRLSRDVARFLDLVKPEKN